MWIMAVMDGAIANVALPTIAQDLHASPAFSIWIVNGYQPAITISLLPPAAEAYSNLGATLFRKRVSAACCPDRLRNTRHDVRRTSGDDDAPGATLVIRFVIRVRRS
jgi:hypothetical protein